MVAKKDKYPWSNGAPIDDHTRTKHNILRQYLACYFDVRLANPQIREFKFAIIDGFSGGGRYETGEPGSPLIILEEIRRAFFRASVRRQVNNMPAVKLTGIIMFNDASREAIGFLKEQILTFEKAQDIAPENLRIKIMMSCDTFTTFYARVRQDLLSLRISNILVNLDQCGNILVPVPIIKDIMSSFRSGEVLLTFLIQPFLTYLPHHDDKRLRRIFQSLGLDPDKAEELAWTQDGVYLSYDERVGRAEMLVYSEFTECATYVSPFAIYNPVGWKYWSVHFSNISRAREVYNSVLHENSSHLAHFGRSGLQMWCSDLATDGALYLFDDRAREKSRILLTDDIPREVERMGGATDIRQFLEQSYRNSVAHREDLLESASGNPDLQIMTRNGNPRRSIKNIRFDDKLVLRPQRSFYLPTK